MPGPRFPWDGQPVLLLLPAGGNESHQLQVKTLGAHGSRSEAGFSQAPEEFERHTYIPDPDSGTL